MKFFSLKEQLDNDIGRTGIIKTPHGKIQTPNFTAVGTKAAIKAITTDQLKAAGCQVALCNTYHLHLRPGEEIIEKHGGLHKFMNWDGPLLTDSGGFQVFSLGLSIEHGVGKVATERALEMKERKTGKKLATVDDNGVTFFSHIDGKKLRLTPEKSIEIQQKLGADIIVAFDECTSPLSDKTYTQQAMNRTHEWAVRSIQAKTSKQALLGVIQGGRFEDLRRASAQYIASCDFDGYAVGGAYGKKEMYTVMNWTIPYLDNDKPRHALGIGEIDDIFELVERGADTFDCILPTRNARIGQLYIHPDEGGNRKNKWMLKITNAAYRTDQKPISEFCTCSTCKSYSRAYIRHLFVCDELVAYTLATIHNLHFMFDLMNQIRKSIKENSFAILKRQWLK